jgi:hypothetical protein
MRERQRAGCMHRAARKLIVQPAIDCAVRDTLTFGDGPEVGGSTQPLNPAGPARSDSEAG